MSDAWSAFAPEAAQAIRAAITSGDWSAFAPDVAAALQQATRGDFSGFEPSVAHALAAVFEQERSDPWAAFDPDVAELLRGVFNQELDRVMGEPLRRFEEQQRADREDRAFAQDEQRIRAIYGDAYDKNRSAILRFAIDNQLPNIELAFNAWRGQSQLQNEAIDAQDAGQQAAPEGSDRIKQIETRLAELKHVDGLSERNEKEALRRELDELRDQHAQQIVRAAQDPNAGRQEILHDINDASRRHNAIRTSRIKFGRKDERTPAMGDEERRARMDLEVLDVAQGRATPQKPKRATREQRIAEQNRFDARDHEALAALRGELDPSRKQSAPSRDRQREEHDFDARDREAVAVIRGEIDPSMTAEAGVSAVAQDQ